MAWYGRRHEPIRMGMSEGGAGGVARAGAEAEARVSIREFKTLPTVIVTLTVPLTVILTPTVLL